MKRQRPEQALHRTCAQFLDMALPLDAVWWHPPNGGARSKIEAAIFKSLGVKPGIPDLNIMYRGRFYAIELKASEERLTDAQEVMHIRLTLAGATVTTCTSLDELSDFLKGHIPLRATAS